MMSGSMTESEANSTHMVDSREKIARGSLKQRIARVAFKGVERGDG